MTANDIRNIALLGHGGSGKTSLVEQMLFMTKGIDRLGKTADGNTTCDYDAEEIKRQISISLAFAPVMYKGKKINVMDAPGNFDFSGEAVCAIRAAECAVIVGNAKDGLSVGMERTWKMLGKKPRMMFINRVEEANSDYVSCIETIKGKYGTAIAPIVATKADANKAVTVIVDLLHNKAYDAKGECAIPGDMADEVEALRAELMEAAAGADEELMEKFFETMELSAEDMAKGLKIGVRDGSVCPVLCGSALTGMGVDMLMQTIVDLVPVATDMPAEAAEDDDGNLWVAIDKRGVLKVDARGRVDTEPFRGASESFRREVKNVRTMLVAGGRLWLGTLAGGVYACDLKTGAVRNYRNDPGVKTSLCDDDVVTLFRDDAGTIYAGTPWGFARYDRKTDDFVRVNKGGNDLSVSDFAQAEVAACGRLIVRRREHTILGVGNLR